MFKINHVDNFDNDCQANENVFVNDDGCAVDDPLVMNYVDDDVYEIDIVRNYRLDDNDDDDVDDQVIVIDHLETNDDLDLFYLDKNPMMTMQHCQMFRAYR